MLWTCGTFEPTLLAVTGKSALVMKKGSAAHHSIHHTNNYKINGIGEMEVGGYYYRIRALKGRNDLKKFFACFALTSIHTNQIYEKTSFR